MRFASADEEATQVLIGQDPQPAPPTPEEKSKFDEIVKLSPRAAVLELSYELEEAVRGFTAGMGFDLNTRTTTMGGLIRLLRTNDLIDKQTSGLLDDLRVIGNTAKHGHETDIKEEEAHRLRRLAEVAINQFRILTGAAEMNRQPAPLPPGSFSN